MDDKTEIIIYDDNAEGDNGGDVLDVAQRKKKNKWTSLALLSDTANKDPKIMIAIENPNYTQGQVNSAPGLLRIELPQSHDANQHVKSIEKQEVSLRRVSRKISGGNRRGLGRGAN